MNSLSSVEPPPSILESDHSVPISSTRLSISPRQFECLFRKVDPVGLLSAFPSASAEGLWFAGRPRSAQSQHEWKDATAMILVGKCVSPGLAHGTAHVINLNEWLSLASTRPPAHSPEIEAERLQAAIGRACTELDRLRRQLIQRDKQQDAQIFAAHAIMLTDGQFIQQIEQQIYEQGLSAEAAVAHVVRKLNDSFAESHLPVIQDKVTDILDIGRRLIQNLTASSEASLVGNEVVVAQSVTPSELVHFAHQGAAALITETCGMKSHVAILARGFGLPMIAGIHSVVQLIPDRAEITLDAIRGLVVINATPQEMELEREMRKQSMNAAKAKREPVPTTTRDGTPVTILFNISDPLEARAIRELGAGGVGLFRTEFLYLDRPWWPLETESYAAYWDVATAIGPLELNIRLADFGAEKCPPYADIPTHRNPSLGIRGIRLLLQRDDILRPQVLAIARVAQQQPVTLLLPMLDTLDTLIDVTERICDICHCKQRDQLPFRIGTMIEVPSAALMIQDILPHVDSIAIGLNDLTQYMLAADRNDELVEAYHDALQPSIIRLLRQVIMAADVQGKPVTMCGELAGDRLLVATLLSLGVRRFSVSRSQFHEVIAMIGQLSVDDMNAMRVELLQQNTGREVRAFLERRLYQPHSVAESGSNF